MNPRPASDGRASASAAPDGDGESRRGRPLTALLAGIVAVEAAMFAVAATRGLDLTDEGFYLLNFAYWTRAPAFSFFGAYFEIPYLLAGQSVWAIRVFGFVLLAGSGFWFGRELCTSLDALSGRPDRGTRTAAALASAAWIWNYYGAFPVPYTPSYNLLALACALASAALALRVARAIHRGQEVSRRTAFCWGLVVSVGVFNKFTTGILFACLSVLLMLVFGWRKADWKIILRLALPALLGAILNAGILTLADPDWRTRLAHGISIAWVTYPRSPLTELRNFALVQVPREFLESLRLLMWPALLGTALAASAYGRTKRLEPVMLSFVAFVVAALLFIYPKDNRFHRIAMLMIVAAVAAVAVAAVAALRRSGEDVDERGRWWATVGIVMLLFPFGYSLGTNNVLLHHMGMAAVFPAAIIVSLVRLAYLRGTIPSWAFAAALCALTALPAEILVRQWLQTRHTYRLEAPLAQQVDAIPPNAGKIDVKVDPRQARSIRSFIELTRKAGLGSGQRMIDFTGFPGLVALSGAVPLGSLWLSGGPPFDGESATRTALGYVSAEDVRQAWLLTSTNSFSRVGSWREQVERKVGKFDYENVGYILLPDISADDKSKNIEITVWRPVAGP